MHGQHFQQSMVQPSIIVANPARGQLNRENIFSIVCRPRSRLRICSREAGSAIPSRASQPSHSPRTPAESIWCAYSRILPISTTALASIHIIPSTAIESVPSISCPAIIIAHRWLSSPRVPPAGTGPVFLLLDAMDIMCGVVRKSIGRSVYNTRHIVCCCLNIYILYIYIYII